MLNSFTTLLPLLRNISIMTLYKIIAELSAKYTCIHITHTLRFLFCLFCFVCRAKLWELL